MTTKSRQSIYGASIRAAAERATEARKEIGSRVPVDHSPYMTTAERESEEGIT